MKLALSEAVKSGGDVPVGAVVIKDGRVLAVASNEREKNGDPFAHAEIVAMRRAADKLQTRRLSGCTLYVTLEPCPMCAGAVVMSGIDLCVYGAFDEQYGCCGSVYYLPQDARFSHRVPCIGGVLRDECESLLNEFFKAKR